MKSNKSFLYISLLWLAGALCWAIALYRDITTASFNVTFVLHLLCILAFSAVAIRYFLLYRKLTKK